MHVPAQAKEIVEEWHKRIMAGAPPLPSPTIGTALAAGYDQLMVYCEGCRYGTHVPLRTIRRPPRTQLIELRRMLVCERCDGDGSSPQIRGVTRGATATLRVVPDSI